MRVSTRSTLSFAVLALIGAPALAQQDGSMSGIPPEQLTCADLVAMTPEQVPGTLYFVAGYMHGGNAETSAGSDMTASGGADATTTPDAATDMSAGAGADAAATDSAGADAGAAATTAPAADAQGADAGATTDTPAAADMAADAPADTGATTPAPGMEFAEMVMVTGMFEIPLEGVMTLCTESPDMLISEVIEQHRDGAGAATN